jgi:Raf kinase inhibitor-like YbhB/YbcL family protein
MRAAWIVQGIGYSVLLVAVWYILATPAEEQPMTHLNTQHQLTIHSPAFGHEEVIPAKYTCDGENISPPLAFEGVPEDAASIVLIVDDHDVPSSIRSDGVWDHWVRFNIPPNTTRIGEGDTPAGVAGRTTFGDLRYGGPCPPDSEHRYLFKVYALDTVLTLEEGASKQEVLEAIKGHVLESATLMGRYTKGLDSHTTTGHYRAADGAVYS